MIDYKQLLDIPRLLLEADLRPVQGDRFQPTGFPDLGAACYKRPDGTEMLLVESAQSVANRMELACWDDGGQDVIAPLRGLPYIKVVRNGSVLTNSILEAHRINSEYVMKDTRRMITSDGKRSRAETTFSEEFSAEIAYQRDGRVDWKKFHLGLLKYDPNSLVHGCFLEEIGGRLRVTRALSGFIEASDVATVESGGVKNNIVQPELKGGEGNVPFHRTEFTAKRITAYFNLDLALLRGFGLYESATNLLIALALFKVRRFLSLGLRLRTACDLEAMGEIRVKPDDFGLPLESDLLNECKRLIAECKKGKLFDGVTELEWDPVKKKAENKEKGKDRESESEEARQ